MISVAYVTGDSYSTRREVELSAFSSQAIPFKFIGLVNAVSTQVRTQTLINDIFQDYDNTQIPICTDGVNTTVILDMALRQIVNMVRTSLCYLSHLRVLDAQSSLRIHVRIQRGDRGSGPPLKNYKNIVFLSNTGPDPLKKQKANQAAFNVGPSSARPRNAI